MPLIKHVPNVGTLVQGTTMAIDNTQVQASTTGMPLSSPGAPVAPAAKEAPEKAVYTGRKSAASKDDYWANREERDIEKDKHIRLSGVLQALLGSVNFGQYCTGTTAEDYLAKVEQSALRLAKFVTENAK